MEGTRSFYGNCRFLPAFTHHILEGFFFFSAQVRREVVKCPSEKKEMDFVAPPLESQQRSHID